jgi:hypothetical protein
MAMSSVLRTYFLGLMASCAAGAQTVSETPMSVVSAQAEYFRGDNGTGNGASFGVQGAWPVLRKSGVSVRASIAAAYFGEVTLPADAHDFQVRRYALVTSIGPRVSRRMRWIHVYASPQIGVAMVQAYPSFTPFDTRYEFDRERSAAFYTAIDVGARAAGMRRAGLEAGLRASRIGSTRWIRIVESSEGYERALRSLAFYIGISLPR